MFRASGRLILGMLLGLFLGRLLQRRHWRRRARGWARGHFDPDGYPGWEQRGWRGPHHGRHHEHQHGW